MHVSPRNLILPLLAIFSGTSVGVILIYYLNKKKEDPDDNFDDEIRSQDSKEIKIPTKFVPLVIGRRGEVIDNIRKTTNTTIRFKEEDDVNLSDRVCTIYGTKKNIKLAEEKIKFIINNQPLIESHETWIPQRTVNNITDRGNEILNQIQNKSNAKIILDHDHSFTDLDTNKRVIINGTSRQIATALLLIGDKVQEDKEAQLKAETSSLNRVPRIKTSPGKAEPDNTSKIIDTLKDFEHSKDIFEQQGNGGMLEVYVCAVVNPSQFYIQVIGPGNALLDDLEKEMTDYYESEENRELHTLKKITEGQMVAAKFPIDNKWYRSEIVADIGDDIYDVYFVDFGDRENISKENICELRTDFLSLRLQAIECCLADVKPVKDAWTTQACVVFSHLSALANWQPRIAKIKGYKERASTDRPNRREGSPIPCIELYEKTNDQFISIGKELVKYQLACDVSDSWSATGSSSSLTRSTKTPEGVIEEIDLIATPKMKPVKNVEVIDLTSPSQERKNDYSPTSIFGDKENSSTTLQTNNNTRYADSTERNPFKRSSKALPKNVIPAGYESELSDNSDDFELYN